MCDVKIYVIPVSKSYIMPCIVLSMARHEHAYRHQEPIMLSSNVSCKSCSHEVPLPAIVTKLNSETPLCIKKHTQGKSKVYNIFLNDPLILNRI